MVFFLPLPNNLALNLIPKGYDDHRRDHVTPHGGYFGGRYGHICHFCRGFHVSHEGIHSLMKEYVPTIGNMKN